MSNPAVAVLESALRAKKLDRTLTTALQRGKGDGAVASTGVAPLDAVLDGGLPRGELSEIAGARSSGRTTLLLQVIAAATRRGEIAAFIDTFDRLDVASAVGAGVDLDRLLWVRGHDRSMSRPQASGVRAQGCLRPQPWPSPEADGPRPGAYVEHLIERAIKALGLVLQSGGFSIAAIDLADAPPAALHRLPFTTWMRVQRTIEGSETACLIAGPHPIGRSAGGLTLTLDGVSRWTANRLAGLEAAVRVVSPRRRVEGEAAIAATFTDHGATEAPRHRERKAISQCLGVSVAP
jgi:hypothetical protein